MPQEQHGIAVGGGFRQLGHVDLPQRCSAERAVRARALRQEGQIGVGLYGYRRFTTPRSGGADSDISGGRLASQCAIDMEVKMQTSHYLGHRKNGGGIVDTAGGR